MKELCSGSNAFFCCQGTTVRQFGTAQAFFRFHCETPARLAQIARDSGVGHASLVTSQGANPNSVNLYVRSKGEVEERLKRMGYNHVSIWRPGVMDKGEDNTPLDMMTVVFYRVLLCTRAMPVEDIAKAMLQDALDRVGIAPVETSGEGGASVYTTADISRICGQSAL